MRRRKNRSTWFPVLGTSDGDEGNPLSSTYTLVQAIELNYVAALEVTPLIPDYTEDPSTTLTEQTLRDFVEGQTCIIDRIVGKISVSVQQVSGSGAGFFPSGQVTCCAAIAVLPTDDSGTAITSATGEEINPLNAENLDKPYLWRRTWTLYNRLFRAIETSRPDYPFPTNNVDCGSVMDGPHIDTKGVKRAIMRNQRIFLLLANQDHTPGEPNENGSVFWTVDLRVLGRMRRARNRSLFT